MNTLRFLKVLLFLMCTLPAIGQSDRFLSTGYSALQENGWKDWTTSSDAGFVIDYDSLEIRFEHTSWASHIFKINNSENSETEDGIPMIIFTCTDVESGEPWEIKFNEWKLYDGFTYYWYYRFTLKNPSGTVRFMTRKAV